jgi:putative phosphoesterase
MTSAIGTRIGVISDTHGLLRPEAAAALRGVDRIIHAGDIGSEAILTQLGALAPVVAIRGNNDVGAWAKRLGETDVIEVEDARIFVLHDLGGLRIDPRAEGYRVVIAGHSHRPGIETREGVLYLNPGSAGPRRFTLPISVAMLRIRSAEIDAEILELAG